MKWLFRNKKLDEAQQELNEVNESGRRREPVIERLEKGYAANHFAARFRAALRGDG